MTSIGASTYSSASSRYSVSAGSKAVDSGSGSSPVFSEANDVAANREASTVTSLPSMASTKLQGQLFSITGQDWERARINVAELPEAEYQVFVEQDRQRIAANEMYLQSQYTSVSTPDYSSDPRNQPYAIVRQGDNIVATIDNAGAVGSGGSELADGIQQIVENSWNSRTARDVGPDAAHDLAEQIAKFTGGNVVVTNTSLTQSQFDGLPEVEKPTSTVDTNGMKKDPLYAQLESMNSNLEQIDKSRSAFISKL